VEMSSRPILSVREISSIAVHNRKEILLNAEGASVEVFS
jgi:hypothetical protein